MRLPPGRRSSPSPCPPRACIASRTSARPRGSRRRCRAHVRAARQPAPRAAARNRGRHLDRFRLHARRQCLRRLRHGTRAWIGRVRRRRNWSLGYEWIRQPHSGRACSRRAGRSAPRPAGRTFTTRVARAGQRRRRARCRRHHDRLDQGGLGGCPYAPGATGNIVTEDPASCSKRWATTPASTSTS